MLRKIIVSFPVGEHAFLWRASPWDPPRLQTIRDDHRGSKVGEHVPTMPGNNPGNVLHIVREIFIPGC